MAPEQPGQQLSRDEFQELVRDLGVEEENGGAPAGGRKGRSRSATAAPPPAPPVAPPAAPERDPAADLTPEDLVLKEDPKPRQKSRRAAGRRNKRHGRSR